VRLLVSVPEVVVHKRLLEVEDHCTVEQLINQIANLLEIEHPIRVEVQDSQEKPLAKHLTVNSFENLRVTILPTLCAQHFLLLSEVHSCAPEVQPLSCDTILFPLGSTPFRASLRKIDCSYFGNMTGESKNSAVFTSYLCFSTKPSF
jgi:hypothetical protein